MPVTDGIKGFCAFLWNTEVWRNLRVAVQPRTKLRIKISPEVAYNYTCADFI